MGGYVFRNCRVEIIDPVQVLNACTLWPACPGSLAIGAMMFAEHSQDQFRQPDECGAGARVQSVQIEQKLIGTHVKQAQLDVLRMVLEVPSVPPKSIYIHFQEMAPNGIE